MMISREGEEAHYLTIQQHSDDELLCIGFIDLRCMPLEKGADKIYVVDEFEADGCTIPIYIRKKEFHRSPQLSFNLTINQLKE